MQLDPDWDPLRFEEIAASLAPQADGDGKQVAN
jgi:hypothetical protein